jgi:NDP-sugar pyrophosphorylase family protein
VRGEFEVGIDPTARVDPDSKVIRSAIGAGAVIAAGSEIVDSVVMAGARVAAGTRIERSIIGGRSSIGESSALRELTVVGYDQDVPAGTVASGECFPSSDSW